MTAFEQTFLTRTSLKPAAGALTQPRLYTYTQIQHDTITHESRIDDFLANTHALRQDSPAREWNTECAGTTDHLALHLQTTLPYKPPRDASPHTEQEPRRQPDDASPTLANIVKPITQSQSRAISQQWEAEGTTALVTLHATLALPNCPLALPNCSAQQIIDSTVAAISHHSNSTASTRTAHDIITGARAQLSAIDLNAASTALYGALAVGAKLMLQTCPQKPPRTSRAKPSRTEAKKLKRLIAVEKQKKQQYLALVRAAQLQEPAIPPPTAPNPSQPEPPATPAPATAARQEWQDALKTRRTTQKETSAKAASKWLTKISKLFATSQSKAAKIMLGKSGPRQNLTAVRHPATQHIATTSSDINDALHAHFQAAAEPTGGQRTGRYRPEDKDTTFPWNEPGAPDGGFLLARTAHPDAQSLLPNVADSSNFQRCMQALSRNKSPGPDGIPNELLKCMPEALQSAVHTLMCVAWIKAELPAGWSTSDTILLYKKADPLSISNYRPIALCNTLYKLYTSLVTRAATEACTDLLIHSEAQEGFQKHKGTERQIMNLLHVIEDAALMKRDLYVAYIDFSNAFGTIDHDRLLTIMHHLGLPTDFIEVVRNLYSSANTTIRTTHGRTNPVHIRRGTMQGDTLSPLLFIIFLEPLLRWLHYGGRGYRYGCLTNSENDEHNCSSLGYADDLTVAANSRDNLRCQTDKIARYAAWGGMRINRDKSACTGILHHYASANSTDKSIKGPACDRTLKRLLAGHIHVGTCTKDGKRSAITLPYIPPHKPYRYLGVEITMTLDWRSQLKAVKADLTDAGEELSRYRKLPRQCYMLIKQCLKAKVAYSLPTMAYTQPDIRALDAQIAGIARRCVGLPRDCATRAILLPAELGGLGIGSLREEYVQRASRLLVISLNDTGRLGVVTRRLLHLQAAHAGSDLPLHDMKRAGQFFVTLKQLTLLQDHDLLAMLQGKEFTAALPALVSKLRAAEATTPAYLRADWISPLTIDLGLNLADLVDANTGRHIIDTTQLDRRFPKGRVKDKHKRALNRFTVALCKPAEAPPKSMGHKPLPMQSRTLPAGVSKADLNSAGDLPKPIPQRTLTSLLARWQEALPSPAAPPKPSLEVLQAKPKQTAKQRHSHFIKHDTRTRNPEVEANDDALPGSTVHDPSDPTKDLAFYMSAAREFAPLAQQCKTLGTTRWTGTWRSPTRQMPARALITGPHTHTVHALLHTRPYKQPAAPTYARLYLPDGCPATTPPPAPAHSHNRRKRGSQPTRCPYTHHAIQPRAPTRAAAPRRDSAAAQPSSRPAWRKVRDNALNGRLPQSIAGVQAAQHITAHLTNRDDIIAAVVSGPMTHKTNAPPPKRKRKQGPPPEEPPWAERCRYRVRWQPTLTTNGILRAYELQNYNATSTTKPPCRLWGQGIRRFMVQVHWAETEDPLSSLSQNPGWAAALARYTLAQAVDAPPDPTPPPALDNHLTSKQRQGRWRDPAPSEAARKRAILRCSTIDVKSCNPDTDIHPTGQYCIQMGTREPGSATGTPSGLPQDPDPPARVYGPDGRCIGTVSAARLALLHARYRTLNPTHPPERFAAALASLIIRYRPSKRHKESSTNPAHEVTLCPDLMSTLTSHIKFQTEAFASPLNAHCGIPAYYTTHPQDSEFGAAHDCYSRTLDGISFVHPPPQPEHTSLAMAWAVASAEAATPHTPHLSVVVVPYGDTSGYTAWLQHPLVHDLGHIKPAHAWAGLASGLGQPQELPAHRRGLHLLCVTNERGRLLLNQALESGLALALADALGHTPHLATRKPPTDPDTPNPWPPTPRKLKRRILAQSSQTPQPQPPRDAPTLPSPTELATLYRAYVPLAHTRGSAVFTDGSKVPHTREYTGLGAAVWDASDNRATHIDEDIAFNTPLSTILRCESSAIRTALRLHRDTPHLRVYTDSLVSLFILRRAIMEPESLHVSKHREMFGTIVDQLAERALAGHKTSFYHVRSHQTDTCVGNQKADEAAQAVATRTVQPDATETLYSHPYEPLEGWIAQKEIVEHNGNLEERLRYANDLNRDLKKMARKSTATGYTKSGLYAELWEAARKHIDERYGLNLFDKFSFEEARCAFKYRWGLSWNAKRAARVKHPMPGCAGGECPLCRGDDGGTHTLGGCTHPRMKAAYIARHNRAVQRIAKAISQGHYGGCVMYMDAGKDAPTYSGGTRIPAWMLPSTPESVRKKLRPDLLVIPTLRMHMSGLPARAPRTRRQRSAHKVYVIEVGYCSDLNHPDKRAEKLQQHEDLVAALRDAGWDVMYSPDTIISLGHTGTVTPHLHALLKTLGCPTQSAHSTCRKLVQHAVHTTTAITALRREIYSHKWPGRPP